jgi:hypothetical protein
MFLGVFVRRGNRRSNETEIDALKGQVPFRFRDERRLGPSILGRLVSRTLGTYAKIFVTSEDVAEWIAVGGCIRREDFEVFSDPAELADLVS